MSDIKFAHVKLGEIIDFDNCKSNGSSFTKTFINANKGDIPVYGASSDEQEVSYGYVKDNLFISDKSGKSTPIRYFENCLTWNIDGSIAIFLRKGRFSLSEKVIPLLVFEELKPFIDLEYLRFSISQSKEISNFGFSNKAGKSRLKEIEISIPITDEGKYDVEEQKSISERYKKIEKQKERLISYAKTLKSSLVVADFASQYKHIQVNITDLFTPIGGNGKFTKGYCLEHQGKYPVYSSNNFQQFANCDTYEYDGDFLSWSIVGCAGYITHHNGKFSITNNRGILIPTEECKNIDMEYIKYVLEPIFRSHIKGRMGHNGENEYTTLNSAKISRIKTKISIPINDNGEFDIKIQKEIAQKYKKIKLIMTGVVKKIDELVNVKIAL